MQTNRRVSDTDRNFLWLLLSAIRENSKPKQPKNEALLFDKLVKVFAPFPTDFHYEPDVWNWFPSSALAGRNKEQVKTHTDTTPMKTQWHHNKVQHQKMSLSGQHHLDFIVIIKNKTSSTRNWSKHSKQKTSLSATACVTMERSGVHVQVRTGLHEEKNARSVLPLLIWTGSKLLTFWWLKP